MLYIKNLYHGVRYLTIHEEKKKNDTKQLANVATTTNLPAVMCMHPACSRHKQAKTTCTPLVSSCHLIMTINTAPPRRKSPNQDFLNEDVSESKTTENARLLKGRVKNRGSGRIGSPNPTRPMKLRMPPDPTRPDPLGFEDLLTREQALQKWGVMGDDTPGLTLLRQNQTSLHNVWEEKTSKKITPRIYPPTCFWYTANIWKKKARELSRQKKRNAQKTPLLYIIEFHENNPGRLTPPDKSKRCCCVLLLCVIVWLAGWLAPVHLPPPPPLAARESSASRPA